HRQVFVDLLTRGIEQRDLAGHALGGADLAGTPVAFQHLPFGRREAVEQRVRDVLDGDGAIEVAQDVPSGHGNSSEKWLPQGGAILTLLTFRTLSGWCDH